MYFFEQNAVKKLLGLLGTADALEAVGGEKDSRLEVLEYDDVCLMDTTTTDYSGRVCLVKAPGNKGPFFRRLFIDGDTAIMFHVTDGNELKRCTLEELEIHGVVAAILRKLEAEERPDQTMWAELEDKYPLMYENFCTEHDVDAFGKNPYMKQSKHFTKGKKESLVSDFINGADLRLCFEYRNGTPTFYNYAPNIVFLATY